jgi:hypothetical protein
MGGFGFSTQQIMPIVITLIVIVVIFAFLTLWNLHNMRKRTKGKVLVTFYTMEGTEYRCLCAKDGEECLVPPMGKEYEKLTGKQRTSDLPPVYFTHPSKRRLVEYPESGFALAKVLLPSASYCEWNAEPVDPYGQDYIVSSELVSVKTRKEVGKYLVYSARDQLKVVEEFERLMKYSRGAINPTYIYIGLGLAILAAGYAAYQVMNLSKLLTP